MIKRIIFFIKNKNKYIFGWSDIWHFLIWYWMPTFLRYTQIIWSNKRPNRASCYPNSFSPNNRGLTLPQQQQLNNSQNAVQTVMNKSCPAETESRLLTAWRKKKDIDMWQNWAKFEYIELIPLGIHEQKVTFGMIKQEMINKTIKIWWRSNCMNAMIPDMNIWNTKLPKNTGWT